MDETLKTTEDVIEIKPKTKKVKVSKVAIDTGTHSEPEYGPSPEESKLAAVTKAAELIFEHYRKTHTMKAPDDFNYPGFKELFAALN